MKSSPLAAAAIRTRSGFFPFIAASLSMACAVVADQTWSGAADALWSNPANWSSAVPAAADIAIFDTPSTLNLATTLGADQSVAGIRIVAPAGPVSVAATNVLTIGASGIDLSAATQNFTFSNATVLGASQTWNVAAGRTLQGTTTAIVSGAFGITKSGAGSLTLQANNTFTGGANVTGGTLTVRGGSAGTGAIGLSNGTTLRIERVTSSTASFVSNAITLAPASSVIITSDLAGNGYSGIVSGDSASVFQIGTTGSLVQVSFGAGASTQQFSGFTGTVRVFDGASLRFSSTSALNNGGTGTTFDLGTSGVLTARNSGTVNLGSLVGSGTVSGASGATGTTIYSIGAKSVSSTFNGSITDSAADRKASLTKTGTEILTLAGNSTYSGATNINSGTLLVTGSINGFGTAPVVHSAVTVGAAGTLGGTGSLSGTVTVNGTIAPGLSPGTLTINNNLILNSTATLSYELNGTNQAVGGGVNDLLSGVINLTLDGTLNVTELGSFGGLSSGSWRLINYSGLLTNNSLELGARPASDPGTNFAIDTVTPGQVNLVLVPEPGTALLGLLAGLGLLRRRRV